MLPAFPCQINVSAKASFSEQTGRHHGKLARPLSAERRAQPAQCFCHSYESDAQALIGACAVAKQGVVEKTYGEASGCDHSLAVQTGGTD
ncbi:hypothetical protein AB839_03115 [Stenotrophomonas sp. DDT-1]|nr:hypothetical protein AB839_03115 [Stenotrophomonas sp. DDT-1]